MPLSYFIVERFEGELAVLEREAGVALELPRAWLPAAAREGDVLRLRMTNAVASGTTSFLRFTVDEGETAKRRARATELREALPKGPEGDLAL